MLNQQGRHPRLIHAYADPIAGHSRLRYLEQRTADPVAVADRNLTIGQALYGKVLSELPEREIISLQLTFPESVRIHLINKYRTVLSTVTRQVALSVALDVEPPNQATALNRRLPHGRIHGLPVPGEFLRTTYVH
jgi:hypothetical protein